MTWWRRLADRSRLDAQIDAEMTDHVERQIADLVRSGLTEAEARRQAAAMFGSRESAKEACRDARGTRWGLCSTPSCCVRCRSLLRTTWCCSASARRTAKRSRGAARSSKNWAQAR